LNIINYISQGTKIDKISSHGIVKSRINSLQISYFHLSYIQNHL